MKESAFLKGQSRLAQQIKMIPFFRPFDGDELTAMLQLCKIVSYDPNELIFKEGEFENKLYFLLSGSVQVTKGGNLIAILKKRGDIFGEMSLFDTEQHPRSATIRARNEATCLIIYSSELEKLNTPEHSDFLVSMYRLFTHILINRLRETTENYIQLKFQFDQLKDGK